MDSSRKTEIQTFVAFDLEASGFQKTKITEIAFVSALRCHILDGSKDLPRVLDKINLCVYPNKLIQLEASNVSGLTNELLSEHLPFDSHVFGIIDSYLKRLPPPVCLIAHNGNAFDFPLLQAELCTIDKALPDNILCADSLTAFRELLKPKPVLSENPLLDNDGFDDLLCAHLEAAESYLQTNTLPSAGFHIQGFVPDLNGTSKFNGSSTTGVLTSDNAQIQKWNETTPKRNTKKLVRPVKPKQETYRNMETTPVKEDAVDGTRRIKKKLTFPQTDKVPKSFKLQDVYSFLMHKDVKNNHRAENDAIFLMECICAMGSEFIDWADNNAVRFNDIKRRW